MDVVNYLRIDNFRSIRSLTVLDVASYVPIVGLNSSGKSNILRALNLFFNGVVDESGDALDLGSDHSSYAPTGKRKEVAVTVGLRLGDSMRVRGQEDFQKAHGISDTIYVRRSWGLGPDKSSAADTYSFGANPDSLKLASQDELPSVLTHVRAIKFIYVPNHVRPGDLIRSELAPLRPTLVQRLRRSAAYRGASVDDLMSELTRMGGNMFGDLTDALSRGLPATTVTASLPSDFADLVFTVGLQAVSDTGVARSPEYEGSGAQSFMLLHILDLADRAQRSHGFGWVQASIWAIEEPESFLHSGLRAQYAEDLYRYSEDERRQVFVTTHQDDFVRVAPAAWIATKAVDGTSVRALPSRDALVESTRSSITTYRHPLYAFPDVPVVLVEGKFDDVYLKAAMEAESMRPRWRLLSPDSDLAPGTGGDALYQYLKWNQHVIQSRSNTAPVIVLRDWEATDKGKYDSLLAVHPYSKCLIAPSGLVNPELDDEFVGIERYLPTSFIKKGIGSNRIGTENGKYTIKKKNLAAAKQPLAALVAVGEPVGPYMATLARWLDAEVVGVLDAVPAEEFHR